jgi:prolyl-tRNA synthetase
VACQRQTFDAPFAGFLTRGVLMATATRATTLFPSTLRDAPFDAVSVSHQLLVRGGFIRQLAAGLYSYLPLGWRSIRKLEALLREEMEAVDAQELLLPSLQPAELWQASGRWDAVDATMFRLRDRRGGDYCLGMTHEELVTDLARGELRSHRRLPQRWFQIGPKFRDELRPRAGLLRVREFLMKDAYSFDLDADGLDASFQAMRSAYERIYRRCDLEVFAAEAFSGAMGGAESIEFVIRTTAGEDTVVRCPRCGYVANREVATSRIAAAQDDPGQATTPQMFPTPDVFTIDALAATPYHVPASRQLKTLVYVADGALVVAVVRGDHQLNEAKLQMASRAGSLRPATTAEVVELMGAHPGSLGAAGLTRTAVFVDETLRGRTHMVTGANRDGFHLSSVDVERDLVSGSGGRIADLRQVEAGEQCPRCDGQLESFTALEIGHIFKLGTHYSNRLGATVQDRLGRDTPLAMGSYGIGLGRLLAAVVEQHHDATGIVWPAPLAPYDVTILALGSDTDVVDTAAGLADDLARAGVEVLYDDRPDRAGVKFKDADLLGVPVRLSVSRRGLDADHVECKLRSDSQVTRVRLSEACHQTRCLVDRLRAV